MFVATERPRVEVTVFGGLSLSASEGIGLSVSSRKAVALIAYLGLAPGMSASRDKLADLLWSDRGAEQARSSLRQTLAVLRRELGPGRSDLIRASRDLVALDRGLLKHNAQTFIAAIAARTTESLVQAADLYTGPFLDGFFAAAGEFEAWAALERERFLSLAVEAFEELARRAGPEGGGLGYAKRLLALEPTREASYRLAMELNVAAGHRDKALQLYDTGGLKW